MNQQVLKLRETVLEKEYPKTLAYMNNTAVVIRCQGKYKEAEDMYRQELKLVEKVLGKRASNHTDQHGQPGKSAEPPAQV